MGICLVSNEQVNSIPPPHSIEAEMGLLGSFMLDPAEVSARCAERHLTKHKFHSPIHKMLFAAAVDFWDSGSAFDLITFTNFLRDRGLLEKVGGAAAVTALFTFVPTAANIDYYVGIVLDKYVARQLLAAGETIATAVNTSSSDIADVVALASERLNVIQAELADAGHHDRFATMLDNRRFDRDNPPPPSVPVFKLRDWSIYTPGNITAVQAQAKAGKTAFVAACLAAPMDPTGDCLGISSENPAGLAVIHFDTEQSPADHHAVIQSALRRAGVSVAPPWLRSYRVADLSTADRQRSFKYEIERANKECGGILAILLDGGADFVVDPNDPAESFTFVDKLHQLAIQYLTVILAIIHENPSSEIGKTRGHLGSQLERKAETNLRLAKDGDGVTTIFADKARHAHIPKALGPRFVWSVEENMHVSMDAKPAHRPITFDSNQIIEKMDGHEFAPMEAFHLCKGWTESTFKRRWRELVENGTLSKSLLNPGKWICNGQ